MTIEQMEEFINLCEKVFSDRGNAELADKIDSEACGYFINSNGSVNYSNIRDIKKYCKDIDIYAGEKDSFGWLTGVLNYKLNEICYFG